MIKSLYYFYYLFILFIKIDHKILQFFTRKIIEILEEINNKMHHTLCGNLDSYLIIHLNCA